MYPLQSRRKMCHLLELCGCFLLFTPWSLVAVEQFFCFFASPAFFINFERRRDHIEEEEAQLSSTRSCCRSCASYAYTIKVTAVLTIVTILIHSSNDRDTQAARRRDQKSKKGPKPCTHQDLARHIHNTQTPRYSVSPTDTN